MKKGVNESSQTEVTVSEVPKNTTSDETNRSESVEEPTNLLEGQQIETSVVNLEESGEENCLLSDLG